MTAHVLVVEDDESFVAEITASITRALPTARIAVAKSRDRACALLAEEFFDLAILDLNIPTQDSSLDADPAHGKYVFHHARRVKPGTKLIVLTGSPSEDFISDMLDQKNVADIWSEGDKVGTVEFLRKIDVDMLDGILAKSLKAIGALSDVELDLSKVNLRIEEDRLIRIFAKKYNATRSSVSPVGLGRSGSTPYRLKLLDAQGTLIQDVIAKIGSHDRINDENNRYDDYVVLLNPGATPRKIAALEFGAGSVAGLFYQLADGHTQSLFSALGADDAKAARGVDSVALALSKWSQGDAQVRRKVAEIRRHWVDDLKAQELISRYGLDWAVDLERMEIQTKSCCVHGDLHGENILISEEAQAVVIDYGDVQHSVASYDPVSLELSAVLQQNPSLSDTWPSIEQCANWSDLGAYIDRSKIPRFIAACRKWAESCAGGRREIAASAYAYLLRQLKYEDTDKVRILALLGGVRNLIAAT